MREFSIESNGRIEKTALYINGEQFSGVKDLYIYITEDGTFDGIIEYTGTDNVVRTKQLFTDYLDNLKIIEPTFTEEEAQSLQLFTIQTSGELEGTMILLNGEELYGIVDLMIHIRKSTTPSSISSFFSSKKTLSTDNEFRAEITYRNEDNSLTTERIFA